MKTRHDATDERGIGLMPRPLRDTGKRKAAPPAGINADDGQMICKMDISPSSAIISVLAATPRRGDFLVDGDYFDGINSHSQQDVQQLPPRDLPRCFTITPIASRYRPRQPARSAAQPARHIARYAAAQKAIFAAWRYLPTPARRMMFLL